MKFFQGLSLFMGFIVLSHGEYPAPEVKPVSKWKFSDRIEFYADVVRDYVNRREDLTDDEKNGLRVKKYELEKIYNKMNEEYSSYSELSSISCIYARIHRKIVSGMLKKLGDLIAERDTLILIFRGVMRKSVDLCSEGYSPGDYFYDLYNMTVLTEWKGYTMLTKFSDLLNSARTPECFNENVNETDQENNDASLHENRLAIYNRMFQLIMELIKCIPEFHACDEYRDFKKENSKNYNKEFKKKMLHHA